MNLSKIATLSLVSVFAVGCAQTEDDTDMSEGAATSTSSTSLEFTASVGAVVVDGKRLCTAALVDIDVSAQIGPLSASGRQIVLGGACIGKLRDGIGGAVFVTQQNSLSIGTPIVSIDLTSQASAGLAIGILSSQPADTKPMRILGFDATVNAGIKRATILRADENGFLVGASAEVHAGVGFNLVTRCTEWHFKAAAGVSVAASVSADEQGFGAAAIVKVNGELRFAASIDGQCIANHISEKVEKIAGATLEAANTVGDAFAQAGAGEMLAVYDMKDQTATVRVRFYEDASELRLNGQGRISGATSGAECGPELLGACKLRPAGGFKKGSTVDVTIDTHGNVFPNRPEGTRVFLSVPRN